MRVYTRDYSKARFFMKIVNPVLHSKQRHPEQYGSFQQFKHSPGSVSSGTTQAPHHHLPQPEEQHSGQQHCP